MSEAQQITVLIAGRPYRLKVKPSEEDMVRRIVKEVNEKIDHFQGSFHQKDKQDCLAMALLTYAVDLQKNRQQNLDQNVFDRLDSITKLIDQTPV